MNNYEEPIVNIVIYEESDVITASDFTLPECRDF